MIKSIQSILSPVKIKIGINRPKNSQPLREWQGNDRKRIFK